MVNEPRQLRERRGLGGIQVYEEISIREQVKLYGEHGLQVILRIKVVSSFPKFGTQAVY